MLEKIKLRRVKLNEHYKTKSLAIKSMRVEEKKRERDRKKKEFENKINWPTLA